MALKRTLENLTSNPKRLFLIDALGAVISAFCLGVVLVKWEAVFGMPKEELFYLALVASIFAIYSFSCHLLLKKAWHSFLFVIAIANSIYCCISIVLVFQHYPTLSALGVLYFLLEFAIVIGVICIEFLTACRQSKAKN